MLKKINLSRGSAFFKNLVSEGYIDKMRAFFMGKWYPIWVAFSVLAGRFTGKEAYFAMIDFTLVAISLLICDSIRPMLPNLITFLYRVPLLHGPGTPYYSDYYATEPVVKVVAVFAVFFTFALVYFYVKNKLFSGVNLIKMPLFIPLVLLSVAFLTAGIFSGNRVKEDLGFAALQILVFFGVYLILYFGLRRERVEELTDYFIYIAAMCAVVLSVEVLESYLSGILSNPSGGYFNVNVKLGWGISNTAGNVLSVLPPLCLLGVMRSKKLFNAIVYYGIALLALLATVMTMSRSAILVGCVGFGAAMIVSAVAGNQKWLCRLAILGAAMVAVLGFFVFKDKIVSLVDRVLVDGFDDNGRYRIWKIAFWHFSDNPWFGNGHFSLNVGIQNSTFTPRLAHNTILQILSSMGIFGLVSYLVYRVATLIPFLKYFTAAKLMLLISCAILIGESLIDNFIFWFNPLFVYYICIVIAIMHCEQAKESKDSESSGDAPRDDVSHTVDNETNITSEGIVHDSPIDDATIKNLKL